MPKSKRDKKISLTKTDKKGLALKQQIIDDIKRCVEKFNSIYVFAVQNMRNEKMKDLRIEWKPSRFFFGKNKVIALGLGRTPEEEVETGLHQLSKCLKGQCGLLFTDKPREYVVKWFKNFSIDDFARSGCIVSTTVTIPEGPVPQFSHAMEPYLRKLGLPTNLERGVVTLLKEHVICKKGSTLTPEQAKLLELFEYKLATFKLNLKGVWEKNSGFEKIVDNVGEMEIEDDNDDDDD